MSGYIPRPPHENGELLERFARMCADDGRIVAGFLMGSLARGEADEFSDVDLGVIATAEAYDDVRGDRARIVESLGEPLFLEDFGNEANIHFILADGTEGELFVARVDRMSDLHLGDYRVLVGDAGIAPTGTLPFADPDHETLADELDRLVRWFWHDLSHFTAAVGRSQPWWAAGQLEALRAACVNLARLAQGVEAQDEAYEKLDTAIVTAELGRLRSTYAPHEVRAMLVAAGELVAYFRTRAPVVADAYGVPFPDRLAEIVPARMDNLSAAIP